MDGKLFQGYSITNVSLFIFRLIPETASTAKRGFGGTRRRQWPHMNQDIVGGDRRATAEGT